MNAAAALLLALAARACALETGSWIVWWGGAAPERAYESQGRGLDEIVVFGYRFGEDGRMTPGGPNVPALLARLKAERRPGQKIFLSVLNDTTRAGARILKDPARVTEMLATPESREAHMRELLSLCEGLDGLELDYENLRASDGPAYAAFVAELAGRLRARGQRLHVVAQQKLSDAPGDGGRALDWAAIGRDADRLSIMLYNYRGEGSLEPGPVCPIDWAERVVDFALTQVPASKLAVILALHGFYWEVGQKGKSVTYEQAVEMAARAGVKPHRSTGGSLTFEYIEAGKRRSVWFEDSASVSEKLAMARRKGLAAVYFWRLGTGDPGAWRALSPRQTQSLPALP